MFRRFVILFLASFSFFSSPTQGETKIGIFGGASIDGPLQDLIEYSAPGVQRYGILGASANWHLANLSDYLDLEFETALAHLLDRSRAWQLTPFFNLRWKLLPWSSLIESSFSLGSGFSYATHVPESEATLSGEQAKLLFYVLLEFGFSVSKNMSQEIALRVHHRSGVFGLVNDPNIGSNYLCLVYRFGI